MTDFLDEDLSNFFGDTQQSAPKPVQPVAQPQAVVPSQVVAPVQQANPFGQPQQTQTIVKPQAVPMAITSPFGNMNVDLGIPGIVVADTGTVVSKYPIERLKISDQKSERFSVLIDKVIVVPYHYFEGVGSVICNGGKCCELNKNRQIRYVYYVVSYTETDKTGRIVGSGIDLKALSCPERDYFTLMQTAQLKGPLSQFDFVVTAKPKGNGYFDVVFTEAGPASWLRSEQAVSYIKDKFERDSKYVLDSIARPMSDQQLLEEIDAAKERNLQQPKVSLNGLK